MKKQKLITALIAIFIFTNLLFAGNPENFASKLVVKLGKDIILTDSQRVIIHLKAKEFAVKLQSAKSLTNEADKSVSKRQALNEYKASLVSVLSNEQKEQLAVKQNERKQKAINTKKSL